MNVVVREFRSDDADFEALTRLFNRTWDHCVLAVAETRHRSAVSPAAAQGLRWMATEQGRLLASASCGRELQSARPGGFFIDVIVDPDARGRGLGRRLYERCLQRIRTDFADAAYLYASTHENQEPAIRFLEREGFTRVMREEFSQLPVADFNPAPFQATAEKSRAHGIETISLREARTRFADWKRRVYDQECELEIDVPSADPYVPLSFEDFSRQKFDRPDFSADTIWVAVQGDEWLGVSELFVSIGDPETAHTGLTGVKREARRKGIATALKLRALEYAAASGIRIVQTDNEENNPMFRINLAMGFKPIPALVHYGRTLSP